MEKFLEWVETSPFFEKNVLAKAAEYTLNRVNDLQVFLKDGRIEMDKNPAENAIYLSIAETAKANRVDFYQYLVKLLTDLPNLDIHRNQEILNQYMPWSKNIQTACRR